METLTEVIWEGVKEVMDKGSMFTFASDIELRNPTLKVRTACGVLIVGISDRCTESEARIQLEDL